MHPFYFYHLNKDHASSQPEVQNIAIWETCLRKIIFTENIDPNYAEKKSNLDLYEDEKALIFIIEVLCGLQSRVIGETEIFGQFKNFLESNPAQNIIFFKNKSFVQFLFKQVKDIREKYITQLGVNSYGSMIRKICQADNSISLVGYGQLAQKIIPWLSQQQVKVHVRDKSKFQNTERVKFHNLGESGFDPTVVVAAPLGTKQLFSYFDHSQKYKIVDCRSIEKNDQPAKDFMKSNVHQIIDLNDLFASIEAKQVRVKQILPLIQQEIKERVQSYLLKVQHRPQGWEDLCG